MNRAQWITTGILVLSLAINGYLGFHLYKSSRILQLDTASYNSFKMSLDEAMKASDAAKNDRPESKGLMADTSQANMDLERAAGTIWGLRTDFAKKGIDIFPIWNALIQSENFSPYDPDFSRRETKNLIVKNSQTLHNLYSTLAPTSFENSGLSQLKQAVSSLYSKYIGYPSYSRLQ